VTSFPRVDWVKARLGPGVVLIAWPLGVKASRKKWSHLTVALTTTPTYLRKLQDGNIGVALGGKSGGLCSIDLDDDALLVAFLALNPALAGALRTRGARGGNIWLRCAGAYPPTRKLMVGKDEVGEWRADGAQTIISGKHPEGHDYSVLIDGQPAEVAFESILWPEEVKAPRLAETEHRCTQVNTGVLRLTQVYSGELRRTQVVSDSPLFDLTPFFCTRRHISDFKLWQMARQVRAWERDNQQKAVESELLCLFNAWWKESNKFVDAGEDYFDYLSKWKRCCKTARLPIDACSLDTAWKLTTEEPLPNEALLSYGPEPISSAIQKLIALCYHLQQLCGDKPFFIGSRDAAKLLGFGDKHVKVFNWLELLSDPEGSFKLLTKVSSGSQAARKTNEWRYHASERRPEPKVIDPEAW
jgi:hypothetical protein